MVKTGRVKIGHKFLDLDWRVGHRLPVEAAWVQSRIIEVVAFGKGPNRGAVYLKDRSGRMTKIRLDRLKKPKLFRKVAR